VNFEAISTVSSSLRTSTYEKLAGVKTDHLDSRRRMCRLAACSCRVHGVSKMGGHTVTGGSWRTAVVPTNE